ncbi:unnamed protein product, partial [Hapterophycus canaliculatus]
MGRTLTSLTAIAAAAGLLQTDVATAFQFPVGARSRAAAPTPAARSEARRMPFSPRPGASAAVGVGSLGMTVAPEGLDSLGIAKESEDAAAADAAAAAPAPGDVADKDGEQGSSDSSVAAAVSAPPAKASAPPPEPEVVDVRA